MKCLNTVLIILASGGTSCMPQDRKVDAYFAAMRGDIRFMAQAQNGFFTRHGRFASAIDTLGYISSDGVGLTLAHGDSVSWRVVVTHDGLSTRCDYVGTALKREVPDFTALRGVCTNAP